VFSYDIYICITFLVKHIYNKDRHWRICCVVRARMENTRESENEYINHIEQKRLLLNFAGIEKHQEYNDNKFGLVWFAKDILLLHFISITLH